MNLSQFKIKDILYSYEDTVVARVIPNNAEFANTTSEKPTVIIKYQNTDYPSIELDARWRNEFKILRAIDSKWVIKAHALKRHQNSHILVLEDFSSTTLSNLIATNTLTFSQRLHIACQLTSALADVHRLQLIHRDINPSNILIDPATLQLKLCDFALTTRLSHKQIKCLNHDLWGKFEYISPEQTGRTNIKVDYRSDFYSLGVTLYELFSGRLPFTSQNAMTLLHSHIARTPEPLVNIKQDIPLVVSTIVTKLMDKSPENRYQSTYGLQADLDKCFDQWKKNNTIENFILAEADVSFHFNVSNKLYGRENELATILVAYQRACTEHNELAMVSGYSGVGKSALVHELQKNIIATDGLFIMGKCDQYNRGQPFLVLIEALQQLLQHLLSENSEKLNQWRTKLQMTLGNNAAIITELLPDLALILGPSSALTVLPPAEAEMRLNMVFIDFVNVLYSKEQPLVIFLDDLQWVDMPTLTLLQQVNDSNKNGLYVIGAYRDNEVDEAHPLTIALQKIEQANALTKIHLLPLKLKSVQELLCNTLQCDFDEVSALAELCLEKTEGNPFFLNQFLLALYQEDNISYNHKKGNWQWRIEEIDKHSMTENVVDLMIEKLKKLNSETQLLASIAAHLGHSFSLHQLSSACNHDTITTAKTLWPVLEAGFIVPQDEYYQFIDDEASLNQSHYCFLHDKVQQAAYQLTPEEGREQLLLRIGKHWLENITEDELDVNLFTLLRVLNGAINIINNTDELKKIVTLNLRAGLKSKDAATYDTAASYLRIAKQHLAIDAWENDPQQTLAVYKGLIETEFLAGNIDTAGNLYLKSVNSAPTNKAKIALILVQADQHQSRGMFPDAIEVLMGGLTLLNVDFPASEAEAEQQLVTTFTTTKNLTKQYTDEQLLAADKMTNEHCLLRMEIHNALASAFYLSGCARSYATNACNMVKLTLEHGQCELSSIGYAAYATAMSMMGEKYPACYQMSKLAKSVSDLWESKYHRATIYQYFASSYQHWCEPIENSYIFQEQIIAWGEEGTNLVFAGYAVLFKACNKFIKGVQLEELQKDIEQGLAFLNKKQQPATINFVLLGAYQSLLAFQGKTLIPQALSTEALNTESFNVGQYFNDDFHTPSMDMAFYTFATLRYAYLMNDKVLQAQCIQNIDIVCMFLPDTPEMTESLFYVALILLDDNITHKNTKDNSNSNAQNNAKANLEKAQEICDQFQIWSVDSPKNYSHKYLLLAAEIARVQRQDALATEFYNKALDAVEIANFIHCEALINERYAKYWADVGQKRIAKNFIKDAHYLYARWGATAKCTQLEQQWPQQRFNLISGTVPLGGSSQSSIHSTFASQTQFLDLHSLLKVNQLLSEEIYVNSLLEKMMTVLMENAGAQHGAIIINEEEQLIVEIVGSINDFSARIDSQSHNINLDDVAAEKQPLLPDTLIRYTQTTMQTLIIDNPGEDARFINNSYLRMNNPKSVLCLPIISQGRLIAIVYLENNITEHAFTKKHKDTVELISAQAAVSLINARHYETLEKKVAQRTEELQLLAIKDGLTGIFNRREFDTTLEKEWSRASREFGSLSLIMIDIDYFKAYNDNYGHPEGDSCIKLIAQTLSSVVARKNDFVARYGGEEFVILMTTSDQNAVESLAQRCIKKIRDLAIPHQFSENAEHVTISIGIATIKALPNVEPTTLIKQADIALYQSKANGRDQYTFSI
ncbi:diguanylate cyclase domain-containing protein [Colwellia piezophila]|uniref:diguanylate cyclase domain-containing protein n=1 Tax=Colwellia piezophila TaxID=211668 RepID=UPI00037A56F1|nr:diguanylate cyclase [Colwellia piezophila]